jgi:hypothetical protein
MGLLLVQEDELFIRDNAGDPTNRKYEVRSLPVINLQADSLLAPADKKILAPDVGQNGPGSGNDPGKILRAAAWQREKDRYQNESCLTIDLPTGLFKAIAPRAEDLPYLAHVRQVDTGAKEVLAINDKGWFSLIISNRLPQANKDHRVLLVSLEGLQDRLQDQWTPQPGQKIRLAVLGTWTFKCEGANDFKAHMQRTGIDSLHLPFESFKDNSMAPKDIVNGAYARGFTVFDHIMRHGEKNRVLVPRTAGAVKLQQTRTDSGAGFRRRRAAALRSRHGSIRRDLRRRLAAGPFIGAAEPELRLGLEPGSSGVAQRG